MIAYKMAKDIFQEVEDIRTGKKKNAFDLKTPKKPLGDFHIMPDGSLMKGRVHNKKYNGGK